MLIGLAGLAVMAIATPAPTVKPPSVEPTEQVPAQTQEPASPVNIPAPPIVLLFGLAAGALLVRRKFF